MIYFVIERASDGQPIAYESSTLHDLDAARAEVQRVMVRAMGAREARSFRLRLASEGEAEQLVYGLPTFDEIAMSQWVSAK
jgi:hypothetical protein